MEIRQWLHAFELVFWLIFILLCIVALLRGKVFTIPAYSLILGFNFLVFISLIDLLLTLSGKHNEGFIYLPIFALIIIVSSVLISIITLRNQYYFWGIEKRLFLEAIHKILQGNHLEIMKESENKLVLSRYPDEVYQYDSLNIPSLGTALKIISAKGGRIDQAQLMQKIKDTLSKYSMSLSSKIFLIPIILLSCFLLYVYSLILS